MMLDDLVAIEIDCATGAETVRPLTAEEMAAITDAQANPPPPPTMASPATAALEAKLAALEAKLEALLATT